ncbi:unnamed protein product [Chironomus riparius]|uniref:Uncharacterized protein n=1 Tax=Chironomus riparius TaxID=315576 RepID=A0A9N9WTH1_9DIPT|nr:unnamed protein product [Chironomus riparius]
MNRLSFIVLPLIVVAMLPCPNSAAQKPTSIADKIEPITSERQQKLQQLQQQQQQQQQQAMQNSLSNRSPFLDTLFNIPIQTLRAVNELVQGIAGGVQGIVAATQQRPAPYQYQQRQYEDLNGI